MSERSKLGRLLKFNLWTDGSQYRVFIIYLGRQQDTLVYYYFGCRRPGIVELLVERKVLN